MRPVRYILQGNVRVTGPHPTPKQTIMMMKEKGPQSRGLRAPRSSLVTYAFTAACNTSKDRPDQQKPTDRTQGKRPKTIQKPRETKPGATIPTSDGDGKKKKTGAGASPRCTCGTRSTDRGRRACTGRREHKGKPKPNRFGFPQRLRKRKRKHGVDETNQTQKRGTQTKTKHGSGLEGLKNQTRAQPQRQKTRNNQQITKPRPQQKNKQKSHQRLQGSVHCGVEGPMGRPAFF